MKPFWIVLAAVGGAILLLLLLLLIARIKVRIVCRERLRVVLYVLGIPITLVSDREKKDRLRDLSRFSNPERILRREIRRQRRLAERAEQKDLKKRLKAKLKAAHKARKKQEKKAAAKKTVRPNLIENLEMITTLIKRLYAVTRGKIFIRVRRMHIGVATSNAADTALLYGVVVQSAAYLLQWIDRHFTHIRRKEGAMVIRPDYLSSKTNADIDIILGLRPVTAIGIGLRMLTAYRSARKRALKRARLRIKQKQEIQASK